MREKYYEDLCRILSILASSYSEQGTYINGASVDELALDYGDILMMKWKVDLNEELEIVLTKIDNLFDSMSDIPEIWSTESLRDDEHWKSIRIYSKEALSLIKKISIT